MFIILSYDANRLINEIFLQNTTNVQLYIIWKHTGFVGRST